MLTSSVRRNKGEASHARCLYGEDKHLLSWLTRYRRIVHLLSWTWWRRPASASTAHTIKGPYGRRQTFLLHGSHGAVKTIDDKEPTTSKLKPQQGENLHAKKGEKTAKFMDTNSLSKLSGICIHDLDIFIMHRPITADGSSL